MKQRSWLLPVLLILGFSLAFSFYMKKWEGQIKKPATVKIIQDKHSLLYLPQYVALWNGFFKEEKLNVEIIPVASENVLLHALKSGRGDVLLTGLEQAIYAWTDHQEKLVAFGALTKKEQTFLVARKQEKTQEKTFAWTDLKDQTVITGPPGSREIVVFKGVLAKYGLAPNRQVTLFTNIPASLQIGAFKAGTGDYILLAEPEATDAEKTGLGKIVASLGEEIGDLPGLAYLAPEEYLKAHPDVLQRFTNAIYKALLWLAHHDAAEISQLIEQHYQPKDLAAIKEEIRKYKALNIWAESPVITRDKYEQFLGLFLDAKEIPGPVPYAQAVENSFAEKAVQNTKYKPEKESK